MSEELNQPASPYALVNINLLQAREAILSHYRPALKQAGLTEQQWRIIRLLAENGTLDFQDLATKACILRPSLTGILSRLEQMNLIVRLKPAHDHRKVFIKLTAKATIYFTKQNKNLSAIYKN